MEGLANYGSDDDASPFEESPHLSNELGGQQQALAAKSRQGLTMLATKSTTDKQDNYDAVGMDLSENEESSRSDAERNRSAASSPSHTPPSQQTRRVSSKSDERRRTSSASKAKSSRSRSRSASRSNKSSSRSRSNSPERRRRSSRRRRARSRSRSRGRRKEEKKRHQRRERDSHGSRSDSRRRSRSRDSSSSSLSSSRRHHRQQQAPRDFHPHARYTKRFDRACNKLAHLEKMGIDVSKSQEKKLLDAVGFFQAQQQQQVSPSVGVAPPPSLMAMPPNDRLLPPGVTGRLREQMERRKALWQKKPDAAGNGAPPHDAQPTAATRAAPTSSSGKVWQATTFAHDQEGKQANKFKRLMGIREAPTSANDKSTDSLAKKQEELFSSMEQQYEVARTATHTMRGVGLGFGSYQR